MKSKAPNKFFAPVVIAGITIGFFVSAYKFIFAKTPTPNPELPNQSTEKEDTPVK